MEFSIDMKICVDFRTMYGRNYETIPIKSGNIIRISFMHEIKISDKFRRPSESTYTTSIEFLMDFLKRLRTDMGTK